MSLSRKRLKEHVDAYWNNIIWGNKKLSDLRLLSNIRPYMLFINGFTQTLYACNPEWLKQHHPDIYKAMI